MQASMAYAREIEVASGSFFCLAHDARMLAVTSAGVSRHDYAKRREILMDAALMVPRRGNHDRFLRVRHNSICAMKTL